MGRELQKKKNRSGIAKVRQRNPKKAKRLVLGNAVIAQNWDKKKTVSQNYALLGLTRRLNGPTGGIERHLENDAELRGVGATKADGLAIHPSPNIEMIPQEAKIERDRKTGAILRVLDGEFNDMATSNTPYRPLQDPLNYIDASIDLGGDTTRPSSILESLKTASGPPKKRTQSTREEHWIRLLIDRHGTSDEDGSFDAMVRDTELNIRQQSIGDLRRRVKKYLAAKK